MDLDQYQIKTMRTVNPDQNPALALMCAALGLNGEAGEAADVIKKHFEQGIPLDRDKLIKELGDTLWYVARLASLMGWNLSDIAAGNIAKLEARYPNGFDMERSINRGTE